MNNKQEKRIKKQIGLLQSMANVYYSTHIIDMSNYSVETMESNELMDRLIDEGKNASDMLRGIVEKTIVDEHKKAAFSFVNLDTLGERLQNKKAVSMDAIDKNVGWLRMSFITVESDKNGFPKKVIITTQIIDEDKKKELELFFKSHNDELTALLNRRAYDEDTKHILEHEDAEKLVVVSIDVNGLKRINDSLGHKAGDELIVGAANCLKTVFSKYGKVYRTGGDEFMAVLFIDGDNLEKVKQELDAIVSKWKGKRVDKLAMSCGYVAYKEHKDLAYHDMEMLADQIMYQVKSEYYISNNIDRRKN